MNHGGTSYTFNNTATPERRDVLLNDPPCLGARSPPTLRRLAPALLEGRAARGWNLWRRVGPLREEAHRE